jgi:hypothetical protein
MTLIFANNFAALALLSMSMFVTPNFAFVDSTNWDMKLALLEYFSLPSKNDPPLTFLQESFNSRLKAEGDEQSTNLYVSNLPKNMTESVCFTHAAAQYCSQC